MEYPKNKTIHQLFEHQVTQTPDAIAVEFTSDRLTYRELNHKANVVAGELRRRGCRIETLVGVYVERSLDIVISVLGILKAGGSYVPLDPFFPKERLAFMIEDAGIPLVVTQQHLVQDLPPSKAESICVDGLNYVSISLPARRSPASSANLAYVLYTSGSTGRPKGVQITHRSVVNFLWAMRQVPGLSADDVLLAVTTLSFDIAGLEIFLPLTVGAKVVIAPQDITVDGQRLGELIHDCGATVMQATPVTWRMLIDSGWRGESNLKVLCGGETLRPDLAEELFKRCGELWNMYGPTETTIWSTTCRLLPGEAVSVGRPIANTKVHVLDADLRPVPVDAAGELYIGGEGLARGYLGRPDLTNERFLPDPFDKRANGRLYKTGDLARYRADGRLELVGRADHQVRIRGFRVELGEIETALARVDEVAEAVVVAREHQLGDIRLIAYIVPDSFPREPAADALGNVRSFGPSALSLRSALRQSLPEYMIPSNFVFLDAMPLTPNRKVDRSALPEPNGTMEKAVDYPCELPIGDVETKLATITASLLKVPRIGRTDSFFDLGGHSLLAASLFSEIERTFGKRLPLAILYRASTIESLAAAIETQPRNVANWPSLVDIRGGVSKARFFCVHGAGGNILLYRNLARHFGNEFSFYGLQSQGLDGNGAPLTTVEEMAERYLGEIRKVQPQGPYLVGGYCLGGTIAYEIAQRLRCDGHEVALVALLDTYNFGRMKRPVPFRFVCQKAAFHWGNMRQLPLLDWPGYLSHKMSVARAAEFSSLWRILRGLPRIRPAAARFPSLHESVHDVNERAAQLYQPKPYPGRVTVFKPKVNYDFYPDRQMGWRDLVTGRLEIVELPVNPHAMLAEPYVQSLADRLKEAISNATCPARESRTRGLAKAILSSSCMVALPFLETW
jgi:amino acid adenylation domain-containing protein